MRWFRGSAIAATVAFLIVLAWGGIAAGPSGAPGPDASARSGPLVLRAVVDRTGAFRDGQLYDPTVVAIPGGGFLMLVPNDEPAGGRLLGSEDGSTWKELGPKEAPPAAALVGLAATPTTVVVLGKTVAEDWRSLTAWRSGNGRAWARVDDGHVLADVGAMGMAGGSRGLVAAGGGDDIEEGALAFGSPDARLWLRSRLPGAPNDVKGIDASDSGFVAFGYDATQGLAWRYAAGGWVPLPVGLPMVTSIAWRGEHGIAFGSGDTRFRSPDGHLVFVVGAVTADGGSQWVARPLPFQAYGSATAWSLPDGFLIFAMPESNDQSPVLWETDDSGWWWQVRADLGDAENFVTVAAVAWDDRHIVLAGVDIGSDVSDPGVAVWVADR